MGRWLRSVFGSSQKPQGIKDSDVEEARGVARRLVRAGYQPREEIVVIVEEALEDTGLTAAEIAEVAAECVADEIDRLRTDMTSWVGPTDVDRLRAAFASLETTHILARENFTCCGTCAISEIPHEIKSARDAGRTVEGFAYFHEQDVEGAVESGTLYLGYGAADRGRSAEHQEAIGRRVVQALEANELMAQWNGSVRQRIAVQIQWHRRDSNALTS